MAKAGGINSENYAKALKNAEKIFATMKKTKKASEDMHKTWDNISSNIFGISEAEFFSKVPKSLETIKEEARELAKMKKSVSEISEEVRKKLSTSLNDVYKMSKKEMLQLKESSISYINVISEKFGKMDLSSPQLTAFQGVLKNTKITTEKGLSEAMVKAGINASKVGMSLREILELKGNINKSHKSTDVILEKILEDNKYLKDYGDKELVKKLLLAKAQGKLGELVEKEGDSILKNIAGNEALMEIMGKELFEQQALVKKTKEFEAATAETEKTVFKVGKGFKAIFLNIAKDILPKMLEFDTILHSVQMNTGIAMEKNSALMSDVVIKSASFGQSSEDTAKSIELMAEGLRTTDASTIKLVSNFAAISKATGAAVEDLAAIESEMMRGGASAEEFDEAMADANIQAKNFGVSTKKVVGALAVNLEKMRKFGFTGGIESLTKMTAQAERLRIKVDDIFDMSERARSIEGAMTMASELQLAGGSFANINPMQLLSAARKGPEELGKILTTMGSDVGSWVTDMNGTKYQFDPVDVDRMQIIAQSTGIQLDSLQKMIQKNAEDNKKLQMFPDSMFNISGLDSDAIKASMSDAIDIKDGKLSVKADSIFAQFGVKTVEDLQKLDESQIKAAMKKKKDDAANLEEQATENMALKESWAAFTNTLTNLFTVLQPVLKVLTGAIQGLTTGLKWINDNIGRWTIPILALVAFMPKLIGVAGTITKSVAGFGSNFKSMFSGKGIKSLFSGLKDKTKDLAGEGKDDLATKLGKTQKSGKTIQTSPKGEGGLQSLAKGLKAMGDPKVLFGVGVTALAGPALLLLLPGLPGLIILAGVGAVKDLVVGGFRAIAQGFGVMGKNWKDIMLGSAAIAIVGVALGVFAIALGLFATISWGTLAVAGVAIIGLVGTLALIGWMMMGPMGLGLVAGAFALVLVAASLAIAAIGLILFAKGMKELSTIDWAAFSGMGGALLSIIPALIGFSLAGLMFLNPFTMLGMLLMISSLSVLAAVMVPLGQSLNLAGDGINKMATGVAKLSEAVKNLDFDKLGQLKEISESLAGASGSSAMAEALAKFAQALGGGGKTGAATTAQQPIIVQLKLPNGRILEEVRVNDLNKAN